jgi:hypothetical protein
MMTRTLAIYSARDAMQADFLVGVLASHEIEARTVGAALSTLTGYLPAGAVTVHVAEADAARARAVVEAFERSGRGAASGGVGAAAASWTCANCGETIEPQFAECWNCQLPRGAPAIGGAGDGAGGEGRLPPDPHLAVDLACVRCAYNLRNLPIDRACPECAHPAFASLVQVMQSQQEWLLENEPALRPCFDYLEELCGGFRIEAVAFVAHAWPLARQRAADAAIRAAARAHGTIRTALAPPAPPDDEQVAESVRELAIDFFGDPLTASQVMQRWQLTTTAEIRRLKDRLAQLSFI